jgi:hypothetical protein
MRAYRTVGLLSSWLVGLSSTVAAQTPRLEPGTRVRVHAPELGIERQAATFEALRGDTLVVAATSARPSAGRRRLKD